MLSRLLSLARVARRFDAFQHDGQLAVAADDDERRAVGHFGDERAQERRVGGREREKKEEDGQQ
jgi:hypothetical protein